MANKHYNHRSRCNHSHMLLRHFHNKDHLCSYMLRHPPRPHFYFLAPGHPFRYLYAGTCHHHQNVILSLVSWDP